MINCSSTLTAYINDNLSLLYYKDIRKFKPLSKEEEYNLFEILRNGSKEESEKAREELIKHNQRFVISCAKHNTDGTNFNDLINEGNLGLIESIDKFNHKSGLKFISYATHWINKYIKQYLIINNKFIKPINGFRINRSVEKEKNKFFISNGRYPTDYELLELVQESGEKISNVDDVREMHILSIDSVNKDNDIKDEVDAGLLNEYETLTSNNNIDDRLDESFYSELYEYIRNILNRNELYLIEHKYGINCEQMSDYELSNKMKISEYKVNKIHDNCINKIREYFKNKKL